MLTTLTTVHVIICVLLTLTVLLQFGKGAEIGAVMGGGASQNVFTTSGKGNIFTKLTTVLAIAFMVNSLFLTKLYSEANHSSVLSDSAPVAGSIGDATLEEKAPVKADAVEAMKTEVKEEADAMAPAPKE